MADVPGAPPAAEPSMEEILASIRKIIASEDDVVESVPLAQGDDVVELTDMLQKKKAALEAPPPPPPPEPEPEPEPLPAPPPVKEPVMAPPQPPPPPPEEPALPNVEGLVSDISASNAAASLEALANTVQIERLASNAPSFTPIGYGARTLEDMTIDLMRPMLSQWLDQNLPAIVERLVQKEVERIAKRAEE